jgi:hypothetical protein
VQRKMKRALSAATVVILISAAAVISYRWIQQLFIYSAVSDYGLTSLQHAAKVRQLSNNGCIFARSFLVSIALDHSSDIDSRVEAVHELGRCGSLRTSNDIADLLQPHVSLIIRSAVANTIQVTGCPEKCVPKILHYLERDWRGETKLESRVKNAPFEPPSYAQETQSVADALAHVLLDRKLETLDVLSQVYGLGSTNPSPFAVHIVAVLKLKEACGALQRPFKLVPPPPSLQEEITRVRIAVCGPQD